MKKFDIAGIIIYVGLTGLVVGLITTLMVVVLQSLVFGA